MLTTDTPKRRVLPHLNPDVPPSPLAPLRFVSLADAAFSPLFDELTFLMHPEHEFETNHFTHLLSLDLERAADRTTLASALLRLPAAPHTRIALLQCVDGDVARGVRALLAGCGERLARCVAGVEALVAAADAGQTIDVDAVAVALQAESVSDKLRRAWSDAAALPASHEPLCAQLHRLGEPHRATIVTNGRVLTLAADAPWRSVDDWSHLEAHEWRHDKLVELLSELELEGVAADDLTARFRYAVDRRQRCD